MEVFNEISLSKEKKTKNKNYLKSTVNLSKVVQSKYIFDYIFSLLYIKKKLNMIIYNKKLQEKFNIKLDNYKALSEKIHIGERNGIGKEFSSDQNILLFEGEYLNGKKNGKGKEYYVNRNIKFEGEYLNGYKIEGKGYNDKGKLIFELERNGKGK